MRTPSRAIIAFAIHEYSRPSRRNLILFSPPSLKPSKRPLSGYANKDGITLAEMVYGMDSPLIMLTSLGQHNLQISMYPAWKNRRLMRLYDTISDVLAGRPIKEQTRLELRTSRTLVLFESFWQRITCQARR
jgi:hypothetical protein